MSLPVRVMLLVVPGLFLLGTAGCHMVPYPVLRQSQLRAVQLHREKVFAEQRSGELEQQLAQTQSQLHTYQQRLDNMKNGLSDLQQQNLSLINKLKNSRSPLGGGSTKRLLDLSKKYKNFDFDPETGVSKFHSDILFDVGSDQIKSNGRALLKEFAAIMNEGEARNLNVLVVGHTDDQNIVRTSTRNKHPTNWHLSTNRANAVVQALSKQGIDGTRLGAAGYSKYQPVVPNKDDKSRQLNRRVEIYVLTPDAAVAGRWNDGKARR